MRYLLDCSRIRRGGGAQVATQFLSSLPRDIELAVVVFDGSPVAKLATTLGIEVSCTIPSNLVGALRAEREIVRNSVNFDVCVTLLGPGLPVMAIPQVAGVAYSNLYYPEIEFWPARPRHQLLMRKARDWQRTRRIEQQDGWIFENDAIAERAISCGYQRERVTVIPPSTTMLSNMNKLSKRLPEGLEQQLARLNPETPVLAYMADWHPNKRMDLLIPIAQSMRRSSTRPEDVPTTVITARSECPEADTFRAQAAAAGVAENFIIGNPIPSNSVGSLLERADGVVLVSVLESFSNSVLEAFASKTSLFITDADWSRAATKGAAVYLDMADLDAAGRSIINELQGAERIERIAQGVEVLRDGYPSPEAKVEQTLEFVAHIAELGKLRRK